MSDCLATASAPRISIMGRRAPGAEVASRHDAGVEPRTALAEVPGDQPSATSATP